MGVQAAVITVSDRASRGVYADRSGALAVSLMQDAGFGVLDKVVVPDDVEAIRSAIAEVIAAGARLVVTTGGTGVGPRDLTPEATAPLIVKELPYLVGSIVARGMVNTPHALVTRGLAGITDEGALLVNLPGSTGGVRDGVGLLVEVAEHILDQVKGGDH
ncbi:MAG: molybdopterin-binding protein [Actinomycetaceae bacterium]|nr:molybdopterin-binding protein [Actinomycetaceae bacterium]